MIGGGIVASSVISKGFSLLSLFYDYGIMLIVLGATIRETFKKFE